MLWFVFWGGWIALSKVVAVTGYVGLDSPAKGNCCGLFFFLGWIALSNLPSITHCEEFKLSQESSLEGEWLSKKQALDAIGAEELKMRVQAGTIRTRRNKEDSRFWEFRFQTEKDSFRTTKEVSTKVKSELGAQKEDVLQFGAMQREALTAEDFDLEAPPLPDMPFSRHKPFSSHKPLKCRNYLLSCQP